MAIIDLKFEEADFVDQGISDLPTKVQAQAAFLKGRFDNISENVIAPRFNSLVDALASTASANSGAKQIGVPALLGGGASNVKDQLSWLYTTALTDSLTYKGDLPADFASIGAAVAAGQGLYVVFNYSAMPGTNKYGLMTILKRGTYSALTYYPVGSPYIYYGTYNDATWYGWYRQTLHQYITLGASDNANTLLTPGVYRCAGTTTGNNFPYTYGILEIVECNGYVLQRMTDFNGSCAEKRRTYNGSSWQAWA